MRYMCSVVHRAVCCSLACLASSANYLTPATYRQPHVPVCRRLHRPLAALERVRLWGEDLEEQGDEAHTRGREELSKSKIGRKGEK